VSPSQLEQAAEAIQNNAASSFEALRAQSGQGAQGLLSQALGLNFSTAASNGLTIGSISSDSPLNGLGLQPGDRILGVNGQPAGSGKDLLNQITRAAATGQAGNLSILRNGVQQTLGLQSSMLQSMAQATASLTSGSSGNQVNNSSATSTNSNSTANVSNSGTASSTPQLNANQTAAGSSNLSGRPFGPANGAIPTTTASNLSGSNLSPTAQSADQSAAVQALSGFQNSAPSAPPGTVGPANGAIPQSPSGATSGSLNAISGLPNPGALVSPTTVGPANGAISTSDSTSTNTANATSAAQTSGTNPLNDSSLPTTVLTPNGPRIVTPSQAQKGAGGSGVLGAPGLNKAPANGKAGGAGNHGGAAGGGAAAAAKAAAS